MAGEQNEMENEVVDRSPGRHHTLCSDANETLLGSCIKQTVYGDISAPPVTSFIWCSPFLTYSLRLHRWSNLPSMACSHFPVFMYLFISFPSYLPRHYCDISTFPIFISLSSFCLPTHIYTFFSPSFLSVISLPLPPSSSFIFSLINTIMLSLMCSRAPRLSLTCGNLCGMHRPTALLDENVGNISLLSMHANRLWVFLLYNNPHIDSQTTTRAVN